MKQRIIGFDLARAYAIFGMYIVNFNFSFGSVMSPNDSIGHFLNIFTGNSTAIFIICAGMGLSLMCNKKTLTVKEKADLKSKVVKRSWFLFVLGLLLFSWWSGDILHFYGGYMHIAALLLFVPRRYYLLMAISAIIIFHLLMLFIPVETGWDFTTYRYTDFWTPLGFFRNTFFNGWNSIFPWFSYFLLGMWLGRLNWQDKIVKRSIFFTGLVMFLLIQVLRLLAKEHYFDQFWSDYMMAEYFPAFLPFIIVTMGFALMVIPFLMYIGEKFPTNSIVLALQKTGQMTLSHYVIHLILGMIILAKLTGKHYTGFLEDEIPTSAAYILGYSLLFYIFSVFFSVFWRKKFKNGPLELLMRKISG